MAVVAVLAVVGTVAAVALLGGRGDDAPPNASDRVTSAGEPEEKEKDAGSSAGDPAEPAVKTIKGSCDLIDKKTAMEHLPGGEIGNEDFAKMGGAKGKAAGELKDCAGSADIDGIRYIVSATVSPHESMDLVMDQYSIHKSVVADDAGKTEDGPLKRKNGELENVSGIGDEGYYQLNTTTNSDKSVDSEGTLIVRAGTFIIESKMSTSSVEDGTNKRPDPAKLKAATHAFVKAALTKTK